MTDQPESVLRLRDVLKRTGLTRATLYRKMGTGTFPKNVRISVRCMGWRESAINGWIRNPFFYSVEDNPQAWRGGSAPNLDRTVSPRGSQMLA